MAGLGIHLPGYPVLPGSIAGWGEGGWAMGAHHPTLAHTTFRGRWWFLRQCARSQLREIRGGTGDGVYMPRCSRRAHPRKWFLHKMLRMES